MPASRSRTGHTRMVLAVCVLPAPGRPLRRIAPAAESTRIDRFTADSETSAI